MVSYLFLLPIKFLILVFFFFNDTSTTDIYTLSLHDSLPISVATEKASAAASLARSRNRVASARDSGSARSSRASATRRDRKSTRLNSSHANISYAVFCLKKKKHQ